MKILLACLLFCIVGCIVGCSASSVKETYVRTPQKAVSVGNGQVVVYEYPLEAKE